MTVLPTADAAADLIAQDVLSSRPRPHGAERQAVGAGTLALFSGPSFPLAALGLPLVVSLPEFYANYVGVELAVVGLVFMLVRLFDLMVDPVLGALMDATRTRFGRFRPWLAAGAPILMIATYMAFMARPGAGALYMAGWLFALYVGFSILTLGHAAWASTLADGYNERARVYGWLQNGAVIGMVLVLALPPAIVPLLPHEKAAGLHAMGWFIIISTPITLALALWRTPEPPVRRKSHAVNPKVFLSLLVRPAVARVLMADICLAMAPGITGAIFIFFFREARGFTTLQADGLLLIYFLGGLAGAPIWTRLGRRFGKHGALIIAALHYAVMMSLALIFPKGNFLMGAVSLFVTGLAFSAGSILLRAMLADCADEALRDRDEDRTGLLFAMITSTSKIGSALSIGLTFPILQAVGFIPKAGAHNSLFAIHGLEALFVVAPVGFSLLAALILRGYHLDEKTHREIRAVLDARAAAAA